MFRFQPPASADRPWFHLGATPIGTAGVAGLIVAGWMLLWAIEGAMTGGGHPISQWFWFTTDDVQRGQVWRLATWWMPNGPSLWTVIDAALIFYFGTTIEATLGRDQMVRYMAALVVVPAVILTLLALAFDLPEAMVGADPLARAMFLSLVLFMPGLKFFFGIPAWVLAVVFVGLDFLGALATANNTALIFVLVTVGSTLLIARAFGLAPTIDWIPKLPLPASITGSPGTSKSKPRRSKRKLEAVDPVADQLEQMEIDTILDQVAESGMDSLSREQRRKLEAYSRKQRKRRDGR